MTAYYNEFNPEVAAWLRELIKAGLIADGVVDERSIEDVHPGDLAGFTQCHFFAGIGGWSWALRLAGWPDDRPVWTGSCPCQPFSAAGKGAGFADERHLWPAFYHLIKERRPAVVYGEQVAGKPAEQWIDLVHADLEAVDYALGCIPFPSAGVGSPHLRDRIYWLAHANRPGSTRQRTNRRPRQAQAGLRHGFADSSSPCRLADSILQQRPHRQSRIRPEHDAKRRLKDSTAAPRFCGDMRPGLLHGFWRSADWLLCRDGKWRPVEPGTFPLADGVPARVVRLRGYGNAINAEAAAAFVRAAM